MGRVVGIDIGKVNIGWAVVEEGPNIISSGTLRLNKKRKVTIPRFAHWLLEEINWEELDLVVFEKYWVGFSGAPFVSASNAEFTGILKGITLSKGVHYEEVDAQSVKKYVAGDGRASKSDVKRGVAEKTGFITFEDEHHSDAIAIALYGLNLH